MAIRTLAALLLSVVVVSGCGSSSAGPAHDDDLPADAGNASPPAESEPPATQPGAPPPPAPPPLGEIGEWTWLDVPGAVCGLGQPTGFAVNVGTGTDVLMYMEGGGLCWDELSCQVEIPGFAALASYFQRGYDGET